MRYEELLQKFADRDAAPLGELDGISPDRFDRLSELKRDVEAACRRNDRWFRLSVSLVAALYLLMFVGILFFSYLPHGELVLSGTGVSLFGASLRVAKQWREKANLEILLALAINLQGDSLRTVLSVLQGAAVRR